LYNKFFGLFGVRLTYGKRKPKMKPDPSLLEDTTDIMELLDIFASRAEGRLSKNTIVGIGPTLRNFVSSTGITDITKITVKSLEDFKNAKIKRRVKNITINTYFKRIICFRRFFGLETEVDFLEVSKDRIEKIRKQIIIRREFERLLEVTDSIKHKSAYSLSYDRELRVGKNSDKEGYPRRGLLGLNWGDINFEKGTFEVHRKGGRLESLPLSPLSEKYLRELKESGNNGRIGPNDPVFVSESGKRLSYGTFYRNMKKDMQAAGIPEVKQHFHAFRHTCGTWITYKYGIKVAQRVLGHLHISTTEIYVHLAGIDFLIDKLRPDKSQHDELGEVEMKICPRCGAELTPDRVLCLCGYDFTLNKCPECGRSVEEDAKFCPYCTARVGIPKPECKCGYELKPEYKICPNCGKPTEEVKKLWNGRDLEKWRNVQPNMKTGKRRVRPAVKTPKTEVSQKDGKLPNRELENVKIKQTEVAARNLTNEDKSAKKLRSNNGSLCQSNMDCTAQPNNKPYEVILTSQKSRLVELLEEGWEPIWETLDEEYILRRMNKKVT